VAANQAFNQVESLKQIRGFEGQNYVLLKPYIAAYSREQKVNVNTASAWLLTSLDPKLKLSDVENVLTQRRGQLKHWENLTDFWQTPPFDQVDATIQTQMNSLLGVQSNQFLSVVDIEFSGYTRYMQSQLKRQGQNIQVQSRALIPFDQ
jgi:general secretion pathway protein K